MPPRRPPEPPAARPAPDRSPLAHLSGRLPPRAIDALVLLAGALVPLGFAPFGLWFLPPLALAVLLGGWRAASPRRAALRGFAFGLGMFGLGVSWVQVSLHQFGVPLLAFSVSVTVGFVFILALYPALLGYCATRWVAGRGAGCLLLAWPALWTLTEWVRSWAFTGFPWLNLGYAQIASPLAGWAPVGGVYLAGWLSAVTAGALCLLAGWPKGRTLGLLALLAGIWGAGAALGEVQWTEPRGETWRVALVQGNVEQSLKWDPARREATLALYESLSEPLWGRELVVWPETAVPAFPHQVLEFLKRLDARAAAGGTTLLSGMPVTDPGGQRYFNGLVALGASNGVYHKRHLVPFGEYIPFADWLSGLFDFLDIPMSQFSPGAHHQPPVRVRGAALGLSICYEDAFGEEVIDALPEAGLLVNVSNDGWFGDSVAPHQHLEMARMRALETGRFLLRATNTGVSAIIDPHGRVVAEAPQFEQAVLTGEVELRAGHTPYSALGNLPVVLGAGLLAALGTALSRRR